MGERMMRRICSVSLLNKQLVGYPKRASTADKLQKLAELRDTYVITEQELEPRIQKQVGGCLIIPRNVIWRLSIDLFDLRKRGYAIGVDALKYLSKLKCTSFPFGLLCNSDFCPDLMELMLGIL